MPRELPSFTTVTSTELRELYARYRHDSDLKRVILEVARYRQILRDIDYNYRNIHQAWRDQVGGDLIALNLLKQLIIVERQRDPDGMTRRSTGSIPD